MKAAIGGLAGAALVGQVPSAAHVQPNPDVADELTVDPRNDIEGFTEWTTVSVDVYSKHVMAHGNQVLLWANESLVLDHMTKNVWNKKLVRVF